MMSLTEQAMPTTTADAIYRTVRDRIITAEWIPGERLIHRQLAKQFGTSSIPVLEALRRLEGEGLITSYPNAGAQVRVWTESDIISTFLAREALEGVTCRLFAQNATAAEKAKLQSYGQKFDDACRVDDADAVREADIALHQYIAGKYNPGAQSSILFKLMKISHLLTTTITSVQVKGQTQMELGPVGVHDELIAALNATDGDLAERIAKAHVHQGLENTLKRMNDG